MLAMISLYWFTHTFPRSIYPYRGMLQSDFRFPSQGDKPFGYSAFPHDIAVAPRAWIEQMFSNLTFYAREQVSTYCRDEDCFAFQ
jgi:microsomal epoxide hydrolase